MKLHKMLKNSILKFVNKPEDGIYSSQTLYECLFYSLNAYSVTGEQLYRDKSFDLADRIISSQLEDGSFDIGYDFLFGNGLRKTFEKEGTSPESLSIVALCDFYALFGDQLDSSFKGKVIQSISKGVDWILFYTISLNENESAIPYAPLTYNKVHITNATSFAVSALSSAALTLCLADDHKAYCTVQKMLSFMSGQLVSGKFGRYWPYFYLNGTKEEQKKVNDKIDNYHIAQQLYHHYRVSETVHSEVNLKVLEDVSEYLLSLVEADGFVPYTINGHKVTDKVDVWGYSSLILAFSKAYERYEDPRFISAIDLISKYLRTYCCADDYFFPIILNSSKSVFDDNFYPRSDSWVLHAISEGAKYSDVCRTMMPFCSVVFKKIVSAEFRGKENHTLTGRKRIFASIVSLIRKLS